MKTNEDQTSALDRVTDADRVRLEQQLRDDQKRSAALARISFRDVTATFPSEYFDEKMKFWLDRWRERRAKGQVPRNVESFRELLRQMHLVVHASLAGDTLLVQSASVDRESKYRQRYKETIDILAEGLRSKRDGGQQLTPTVLSDCLGQVLRARLEGVPDLFETGLIESKTGYDVDRTREAIWTP